MTSRRPAARTLSLIACLTGLLAACGGGDSPSSTEAPSDDSAQIANPASVFCVEQGGTLEIVDEESGQVGYCNLPDGTRVEEWEYYRMENPEAEIESELPGDGVE